MLYLSIVYHMHQPYYKNLLTNETDLPWVRLHGIKDYLDMLLILKDYPKLRLTFNLTPCLVEQIEDYAQGAVKDRYLSVSYKPAGQLSEEDKRFILNNFFQIYPEFGIAVHPRYYQLYLKKQSGQEFSTQELRDLQVWFNLAWFDPYFRRNTVELRQLVEKGRFFNEGEKRVCLDKQFEILNRIIPAYREFQASGQIEIITNPYYHPILPLLYNSKIARQADPKTILSNKKIFSFPRDAQWQIQKAVEFYRERFSRKANGMWPSEEAVSEDILPMIIKSGINWIITDEQMLFRSLGKKKRDTSYLYQPYQIRRKEGTVNIVFRDCNLSDLIGFVYHRLKPADAVEDFIKHLKNIASHFKNKNLLVVISLDGENAWEYYKNDGWDFLSLLYQRLCACNFLKTTTVSEYLKMFPAKQNLAYLKPGSWVQGNFNKWIGSGPKNKAWEYLLKAREELKHKDYRLLSRDDPIWKQIYIAEGSDWFWWYGDTDDTAFDTLFRMHLSNFYRLLKKPIPKYLNNVIT